MSTPECIHLLDPSTCSLCKPRPKKDALAEYVNPFETDEGIIALYPGKCADCKQTIYKGDTITNTERGWTHVECA